MSDPPADEEQDPMSEADRALYAEIAALDEQTRIFQEQMRLVFKDGTLARPTARGTWVSPEERQIQREREDADRRASESFRRELARMTGWTRQRHICMRCRYAWDIEMQPGTPEHERDLVRRCPRCGALITL